MSCLSEFQYLSVLNVTRLMVLEIGVVLMTATTSAHHDPYLSAFRSPILVDVVTFKLKELAKGFKLFSVLE